MTAKLPAALVERLDDWAERLDRSKSWIVKQALEDWLAEEDRRHELTLEALKDIDEGRVYSQEQIEAMAADRKAARHTRTTES